jgi:hypothetical protein
VTCLGFFEAVKGVIDGFMSTTPNFDAPEVPALLYVCHFRIQSTFIERLVWIFRFRQNSGKGQFLNLVVRPLDEKKAPRLLASALFSYY